MWVAGSPPDGGQRRATKGRSCHQTIERQLTIAVLIVGLSSLSAVAEDADEASTGLAIGATALIAYGVVAGHVDPSRERRGAARLLGDIDLELMLTADAPDHTRLRRLANKAFTPRGLVDEPDLLRLARRFPVVELAADQPPYRDHFLLRGLDALPVDLGADTGPQAPA